MDPEREIATLGGGCFWCKVMVFRCFSTTKQA
jgi:peptide methionine sulfoxide reductase MsrA